MLLQIHEPGQTPDIPKRREVVVGIDFGTTYSAVALSQQGESFIVPIDHERLTSSLVSYKNPSVVVGQKAVDDREAIRSIKRFMEEGDQEIFLGKSAIDICADILTYLKKETEKALKEPIKGAVITVPAYYSEIAREAIRTAALKANLPVLRLLNEPTAAALAYHLDEKEEGVYLVYDLGGGTFDVSVLDLQKGIFQVLSVSGDPRLGGDDLDEALFIYLETLVGTFPKKEGILLARQIKEELTLAAEWEGVISGKKIKITQGILNQLIKPFLEKTFKLCDQALKDADAFKSNLKDIVLVGGTTRIPFLQSQLEDFFGKVPICDLNPDEVVALGAALHADSLVTGKGKLLIDVTPFSLGIETLKGEIETLIPRNSPLPCSVSQQFTTGTEGQTKIKIHIVQSDTDNSIKSLGTFVLADIPPLPAGKPQIKVTFTLDADGLLSVSVEEELSEKKHSLQVKPLFHK